MLRNQKGHHLGETRMEIYVIAHKDFSRKYIDGIRKVLLVGANRNQPGSYDYKDNCGNDNISDKNKNFCELTGLYWVWKHSHADVVGLEHYRRYFAGSRIKRTPPLSEKAIQDILSEHDMVVPRKRKYDGYTCKKQFAKWHKSEVWDECCRLLKRKYPEYAVCFETLEKRKSGYAYNMFIASKTIIDSYCEWLFDVLFELDRTIDLSQYNDYNQRMWGFLSERLFNVWIMKNNIDVYEEPVFFFDETSWFNTLLGSLKA